VYKDNSYALFIKYGSKTDWFNNKTFVALSGCLWKKADDFDVHDDDKYTQDWRKAYCSAVEQMK
jgi:hypothetical protein